MQPNLITEKQGHTMVHAAFTETGSLISVDGTNNPWKGKHAKWAITVEKFKWFIEENHIKVNHMTF